MSQPAPKSTCDYHPYQNHTWVQLHEAIVDKEYQLECLRDEQQRLAVYERESKRKDGVISELRKEVAEYKKCTQSGEIRNASIEKRLSSNESHLQDRIKEVEMLQSELEKMQGKFKSATSKTAAMQKELSKLTGARQDEEIGDLKKQQQQDAETIAALRKELAEKKSHSSSMQERMKRVRAENQDLQKRLECLRTDQEKMIASEKKYKAEIFELKNLTSSGHLLQTKLDFAEQELLKAKDKENTMAIDLGRLESELSELCGHVLSSLQVPTAVQEVSTQAAAQAVTQFADDYFKTDEKLALCEQELIKYKEDQMELSSEIVKLCEHWREFQAGMKDDVTVALNVLAENLRRATSEDANFKALLDLLGETTGNLYSLKEQSQAKLSQIESHIKSCYRELREQEDVEDVIAMITNMASSLQSSTLQISKLKEQLVEKEQEHSASLSEAVTALRQDELKKLNDTIEKIKLENEERLCRELGNAKEVHAVEKMEAVSREQEIVAALKEELESVKLALESDREEKAVLQEKLADVESKLMAADLSRSRAVSEADSYKETLDQQFTKQVYEYKEQAQQYALTIVALEEKLLRMMESCKTVQSDNQNLKENLESTTTAATRKAQGRDEQVQKMEELIGVLRKQLTLVSVDGSQKEETIKRMEEEILELRKGAQETEVQLQQLHCKEVSDLQLTMAVQETIIEQQKSEIENLHITTSELARRNQEQLKMTEELSATIRKKTEETTIMDDRKGFLALTEAGHVCLGEKHTDTINNQKIAISQFRQRINELELAKPPLGSHQATLKELSRVRHELLMAKSDLPHVKKNTASPTSEETPGFGPQLTFMDESPSQEAALQQLDETLQCSERTYKNLVEVICKGLPDLTRFPAEEADLLVATDEQAKKKKVLKERKKLTKIKATTLMTTTENVHRHLTLKSSQVQPSDDGENASRLGEEGPCTAEKQRPEEVIAHLEAVLSATAEELDQQKRLNQSLIQRKNFRESQLIASLQRPRHNCVTSNS